jgi:hypothetical protein
LREVSSLYIIYLNLFAGRLLYKFLNYFFPRSPGLGSVGLMVPMASAGVPHMGKINNRLSPAQLTHSSAKPSIWIKTSQTFLGCAPIT